MNSTLDLTIGTAWDHAMGRAVIFFRPPIGG
jgi:hypothetical protein